MAGVSAIHTFAQQRPTRSDLPREGRKLPLFAMPKDWSPPLRERAQFQNDILSRRLAARTGFSTVTGLIPY